MAGAGTRADRAAGLHRRARRGIRQRLRSRLEDVATARLARAVEAALELAQGVVDFFGDAHGLRRKREVAFAFDREVSPLAPLVVGLDGARLGRTLF